MSIVSMHFRPGQPTEVKVDGIPGGDCRAASKPYLDMLKGKIISDKPTDEASLPPIQQSVGQQLGR